MGEQTGVGLNVMGDDCNGWVKYQDQNESQS